MSENKVVLIQDADLLDINKVEQNMRINDYSALEVCFKAEGEKVKQLITELETIDKTVDNLSRFTESRKILNAQLKSYEDKRKELHARWDAPYTIFNNNCKSFLIDPIQASLDRIKGTIDDLTTQKRAELTTYLTEYFNELVAKYKYEKFINLERSGIKVLANSTKNNIKKRCDEYFNKIANDIDLIKVQDNKNEIFAEYIKTLDVSSAILMVNERHKIMEETKGDNWIPNDADNHSDPEKVETKTEDVLSSPTVQEEEYFCTFSVTATKTKLKALKEFLVNGGYKYE